jgi:hypothetical protein
MSTTARYIASIKSKVNAQSTKIQYNNNTVTTNNLYNGVIPCQSIDPNQIMYLDKICCITSHSNAVIEIRKILDGGKASESGLIIYDGGIPEDYLKIVLDGGKV